MQNTYLAKRASLENYFNEVSSDAWDKLTSNEPVSFVRQLVREGRQKMLLAILDKLPQDLKGTRILDAGCGTGVLSRMLDERGAEVVGVDISDKLVDVAKNRSRSHRNIEYFSGDMNEHSFGNFDYIIAMDSLIHYNAEDVMSSLADFSYRANNSVLFTVIPSTTNSASEAACFCAADGAGDPIVIVGSALKSSNGALPVVLATYDWLPS